MGLILRSRSCNGVRELTRTGSPEPRLHFQEGWEPAVKRSHYLKRKLCELKLNKLCRKSRQVLKT